MPKSKPDRSPSSTSERAELKLLSPLSPPPVNPPPLSAALRRAIRRSGLSLSQLAERAGIDKGGLSRFMNEKGGLSLEAAERISEVIRWPVEVPRYVILNVSKFRGQLCELTMNRHGVCDVDCWEAVKISEPMRWRKLIQEIFRCLGGNE